MTPTPDPNVGVADRAPAVIRAWAERASGATAPAVIPNAVIAFAARHHISLADPRRAGVAILRVLTLLEAARTTAP